MTTEEKAPASPQSDTGHENVDAPLHSAAETPTAAAVGGIESWYGHHSGLDEHALVEDNTVPPPPYSDTYGQITSQGAGLGTNATVAGARILKGVKKKTG
jgi:hypothetical protein